jgi:hypothetical protein
MFTYADGRPIRPEYLSHRFRQLTRQLGLPPIRLHDLRHGATTLALASRADLKVIQQMLGRSSIVTTADTYTSVLPETAHKAAQATADMIIEAARPRQIPAPRIRVTHSAAAAAAARDGQMRARAAQRPAAQQSLVHRAFPPWQPGRARA